MLLSFEPTIVAKKNVTLLQSPPPLPLFNADTWTTEAARDWIFCYRGQRG